MSRILDSISHLSLGLLWLHHHWLPTSIVNTQSYAGSTCLCYSSPLDCSFGLETGWWRVCRVDWNRLSANSRSGHPIRRSPRHDISNSCPTRWLRNGRASRGRRRLGRLVSDGTIPSHARAARSRPRPTPILPGAPAHWTVANARSHSGGNVEPKMIVCSSPMRPADIPALCCTFFCDQRAFSAVVADRAIPPNGDFCREKKKSPQWQKPFLFVPTVQLAPNRTLAALARHAGGSERN